jgi:hypothetical protein
MRILAGVQTDVAEPDAVAAGVVGWSPTQWAAVRK